MKAGRLRLLVFVALLGLLGICFVGIWSQIQVGDLTGSAPGGAADKTAYAAATFSAGAVATHMVPPGSPTAAPGSVPAIPERRLLSLEWPSAIRSGDSDLVRLSLEMDSQGNVTPSAQVGGDQLRAQTVEIPNLYDTHDVEVAARLDMAGVDVTPAGESRQPLHPGETVTFYWSVRPQQVGDYRGAIQVSLHFLPRAGGTESQRALASQVVDIRSVNLFGLGGGSARIAGAAGAVVGSLLGLDGVVGWLFARFKKKPAKD